MAKFYFKWPTQFWKSIHKSVLLCIATVEICTRILCDKHPANIYQLFPCVLHCSIECFHSRDQHLCKFIGTKESVYIRKEFNSHRTSLGHQHGRRFIVLGHQYGRRDVMWKHSIDALVALYSFTLIQISWRFWFRGSLHSGRVMTYFWLIFDEKMISIVRLSTLSKIPLFGIKHSNKREQ